MLCLPHNVGKTVPPFQLLLPLLTPSFLNHYIRRKIPIWGIPMLLLGDLAEKIHDPYGTGTGMGECYVARTSSDSPH